MRIVWHPEVHRLFGEQLSFIFLKPHHFRNHIPPRIIEVLDDLQLKGFHYYHVFGSVDIVIRIWARHEKRDAVLEALGEIQDLVVITVFTCTDPPFFLWWDGYQQRLSPGVIQSFSRDDLKNAQTDEGLATAEAKDSIVTRLQNANLLFTKRLRTQENGQIKFFVSVSVRGGSSKEAVIGQLERAFREYNELEDSSIYTSTGGNYLLKATTSVYEVIGKFVLSIPDFISPADCTTETHLVASTTGDYSDFVDFEQTEPALLRMCGLWKFSENSVRELPENQQRALGEVYAAIENSQIISIDKREIIKKIIQAVLENDHELLREKTTFLFALESHLFQFTARTMSELYGKDWMKSDFQRLKDATKIPNDFSQNTWTFKDSLSLLGKVDSEKKNAISSLLNEKWITILEGAHEMRNRVGHGKPLQEWPTLLQDLLEIIPVYYKIRNTVLSEDSKK
ncbi:hypothetical protein Enr10x_32030 [Gimesia panareensis]|uniref:Uncharacterized protein n=1 Tax=Gimesia panareensis TaxID=2527978 RepID=A0A517Q8B0_9PLAN|nr:hypothetical protein [Gimesia panareensis]QDT27868.1 hypothetical protein Enr10x_32030 [Gimesia panareensis]